MWAVICKALKRRSGLFASTGAFGRYDTERTRLSFRDLIDNACGERII
ncbi:hypothetical protein [Bradyrhizobium sp. CCBAU 11434]|nr:hypothetical protein [Bradyrhizobium sp. CCBAU 11434]